MAREYTPLPPEYSSPVGPSTPVEYAALPPEYEASCRKSSSRKRSGLRVLLAGAIAAALVAGTVAAGPVPEEFLPEQMPFAAAMSEHTAE